MDKNRSDLNSRSLYSYCLTKPGSIEDYPFGPDIIVFKVASKMFALLSHRNGQDNLALKCDPEYSEVLRQHYPSITPGYHLNKRHWNTILLDGSVPEREIRGLIDHSYELVYQSLPRRKRAEFQADW
ncbi:MmcQ/YjbR family DNA-binding protein [Pelosinus propionicus]|uniref:Predicted DNA-binding protein, MmcQ/YjbR family n=1 Tax=Pelosinus propionicus DSM 13327 TaxID=1123291 RepID=A0A1I4NLP5_9FIRM|nr:MmcQ/YjbR family DNA-binding protein [Pelosinus propionicus]SFM16270.1 Predicted DNA-binding protein, MmcQ/YjbR family [Pelosinus propionicus DSM 13327]